MHISKKKQQKKNQLLYSTPYILTYLQSPPSSHELLMLDKNTWDHLTVYAYD